ncbi:MAG: sensor histidine kinase, partial [Arenibacter sp.]|nr:sensor histidine kinase [Arenibacter sp.]
NNDKLITLQQKELTNKKQLVTELIKPMIANLYYWEQYQFSKDDFNPESNAHLEKEIGDFVIGMDSYSQFRLINLDGMEVFRLNREGNGNVVKSSSLQDKGDRDYFLETRDLEKNQIYLSPLNLNRENGVLEVPYKPMIRGVAPILDSSGAKLGVVVINFSAGKLLDMLKRENHYPFVLLDRQGNYLASNNSDKEFAHLIPDAKNTTFSEENPALWDSLNQEESTFLYHDGDLWIKSELDFKKELSQIPIFQYQLADIRTNNHWLLLNHIESKLLNVDLKKEIYILLLINVLGIFTLLYLALIETKAEIHKRRYLESLETVNRELKMKKNSLENTHNKLALRNAQLLEYNNIVAHNLRAPTTSVSALVSMLVETKDYEEAKSYFPKLKSVTQAINTLVDDLLVYVRILNDDKVETENIALEPLVKATLNLYMETLDGETIDVKTDYSGWQEIRFSRIYLQSVLQNLISNAIKYRDMGKKPSISIKTQIENRQKVLVFTDNGVGMDLKRHGTDIFKLYKRLHRNLSGKGMGLFLVKTQLESLGASIEVSSELGQGTTFKITFDNYE